MFRKSPTTNIRATLLRIRNSAGPENSKLYLRSEYHIATPDIKRKEGKTRSVGVHPCHEACLRGANTWLQVPGVFTIIMKATVMPLNTSSDISLPDVPLPLDADDFVTAIACLIGQVKIAIWL
jgi:hypothetical protein